MEMEKKQLRKTPRIVIDSVDDEYTHATLGGPDTVKIQISPVQSALGRTGEIKTPIRASQGYESVPQVGEEKSSSSQRPETGSSRKQKQTSRLILPKAIAGTLSREYDESGPTVALDQSTARRPIGQRKSTDLYGQSCTSTGYGDEDESGDEDSKIKRGQPQQSVSLKNAESSGTDTNPTDLDYEVSSEYEDDELESNTEPDTTPSRPGIKRDHFRLPGKRSTGSATATRLSIGDTYTDEGEVEADDIDSAPAVFDISKMKFPPLPKSKCVSHSDDEFPLCHNAAIISSDDQDYVVPPFVKDKNEQTVKLTAPTWTHTRRIQTPDTNAFDAFAALETDEVDPSADKQWREVGIEKDQCHLFQTTDTARETYAGQKSRDTAAELQGKTQTKQAAYVDKATPIFYKLTCPFCLKPITRPLEHYQRYHRIDKDVSKEMVQQIPGYRRKQKEKAKSTRKPMYHWRKQGKKAKSTRQPMYHCPMPHCVTIMTRPNDHLRVKHGLPTGDIRLLSKLCRPAMVDVDLDFSSADDRSSSLVSASRSAIKRHSQSVRKATVRQATVRQVERKSSRREDRSRSSSSSSNSFAQESSASASDRKSTPEIRRKLTKLLIRTLTDKFEAHLPTANGGRRKDPKHYGRAVRRFLRLYRSLDDITAESVLDIYIPHCEQQTGRTGTVTAKTLTNSLTSVGYFLEFMLQSRSMLRQYVSRACKKNFKSILSVLPNWKKSYSKDISKQRYAFRVEDEKKRIHEEDTTKFIRSAYAITSSKDLTTLADFRDPIQIRQHEFCRLRNYMILLINLINSSRCGVIKNFTLEEYASPALSRNQQSTTYQVKDHKTAVSKGPAHITLEREEVKMLAGYMRMRSCIKTASDKVFLNFTGNEMSQSNIAEACSQAFQQANVGKRICSNKCRKLSATSIRNQRPDLRSALASHMGHTEQTAEKDYAYYDRIRDSEAATSATRQILLTTSDNRQTTAKTSALSLPIVTEVDQLSIVSINQAASTSRLSCSILPVSPSASMVNSPITVPKPFQKRIRWSDDMEKLVSSEFDVFIREENFKVSDVHQKLTSDPDLTAKLLLGLRVDETRLTSAVREKLRVIHKQRQRC